MKSVYLDPKKQTSRLKGYQHSAIYTKLRNSLVPRRKIGVDYSIGTIEIATGDKKFRARTNKTDSYDGVAYVTNNDSGKTGRVYFNYSESRKRITGRSNFNYDSHFRRFGQHVRRKFKTTSRRILHPAGMIAEAAAVGATANYFLKEPPKTVQEAAWKSAIGIFAIPAALFATAKKVDYGYKKQVERNTRNRLPDK
ncbi:MAG: hypothetical protein JW716_03920 [Candidatus Aenigmarchaeota archaeon]|nr:hypothetical protein [Candidatus Aenigmarchaeota archaeon]